MSGICILHLAESGHLKLPETILLSSYIRIEQGSLLTT
jgi:hypothetical protein